jgi:ATP-dependent DNA helicase RecG
MEWRGVEALLVRGHGQEIDLLSERTSVRRIAESLAAMANAIGGTIILAGSARKTKLGLADIKDTVDKAMEAMLLCQPKLVMPLPGVVSDASRAVVLLHVPRGLSQVYSVEGRYLHRAGRDNLSLSSYQLRRLLIERGQISYETQEAEGAGPDDIDWPRVKRYGETLGLAGNHSLEELLRRRGCLARPSGRPNYAGVLLFGREPERFVRSSEIVAVRYAGREMGERFVREDIRGPLPDQIQRAEAFVLANMRRGIRLIGLDRVEKLEYPQEAIREAIVNAVAHRDYSIAGDGIRLFMFSDRIIVHSPGRLPGHVTVENILDERYSRNEVIVQLLADMGYIERLGYGIDRMVSLLEIEGLPAPSFNETANGFEVTLWGHGEHLTAPEPARGRWHHAGLNARQEKAMVYLDAHERITSREYQALCPDVSVETLRRDLVDLVRRGILLKIGEKRGTFYVLR